MPSLGQLQERRADECRLTPDRALQTLDEAEAFLRDRGLLTRTPDCSLPSLVCDYEVKLAAGGLGPPVADWGDALAGRVGVYPLKIHRGKTIFLMDETAAIVDPICRAEIARTEAADPALGDPAPVPRAGGAVADRGRRRALGLKPRELKAVRYPLERCGAVVSRDLRLGTEGGGHVHASEAERLLLDRGARRLKSHVGSDDAGGIAFLERRGFQSGRRDIVAVLDPRQVAVPELPANVLPLRELTGRVRI